MNYVTRKGGATVTIFVPYDCNNHCPFCINKEEYKDTSNFNIDEIIKSIRIMNILTPECDVVFTGGEPLANLTVLDRLLREVHSGRTLITRRHKVFINTSLPVSDKCDIYRLAQQLNDWYRVGYITGINVSRHLHKYVQECSDDIFNELCFQPRINCVLYNLQLAANNLDEMLINFVERFKDITGYIQFRKDYVVTTPENLYDEKNDKILNKLKKVFKYKKRFGEYRMRVGYEFDYKGYKITYHKTLPYSKIKLNENEYVLYDIIIKQDGTIREDWDTCSTVTFNNRKSDIIANELDLTAYRRVRYEEYK